MSLWLQIALASGAAFVVLRALVTTHIVDETQFALLYRNGRFLRLLEPGRYYFWRYGVRVDSVDRRETWVSVPGQEILSLDGIALKLSAAGRYAIEDPRVAFTATQDYRETLYLQVQLALREIAAALPVRELLAKRKDLGAELLSKVQPAAAAIGLRLAQVEVKDLMFPGDLKRLFAQSVQAREEGRAALERARGETAALRKLVNAAPLIERHPALLQLRALHAASEARGSTIVVGIPPDPALYGALAKRRAKSAAATRPSSPPPESDSASPP